MPELYIDGSGIFHIKFPIFAVGLVTGTSPLCVYNTGTSVSELLSIYEKLLCAPQIE